MCDSGRVRLDLTLPAFFIFANLRIHLGFLITSDECPWYPTLVCSAVFISLWVLSYADLESDHL